MKYSEKEGDKYTLTKNELKQLLNKEFGILRENSSNTDELDKLFSALDVNCDARVDFPEFSALVSTCFMLCDPRARPE